MSFSPAIVRLVPASGRSRQLSRNAIGWQSVIAITLIGIGVGVWWLSLSAIALGQMTDLGLGSVLPAGTWLSIGLVTVGWVFAWRSGNDFLIVTGILATILVLFGLGVFGEPTLRFATTWTHVGIANYIATHGSVNPNIDAYFNWPGFFILSAFISEVAGLKNIIPVARGAPLFFNVMYMLPLVSIGRSLFHDRRVVWLGVWLFFVNNWIGQDYYSPQGLGFFMYLVVIAVLLRWFKGMPKSGMASDGQRWRLGLLKPLARVAQSLTRKATIVADAPSIGSQRLILITSILVITAAVVASHQLTPFALVVSSAALVLIGWCQLRTLPLGILLITLLWSAYMAVTYLFGHLQSLTSSVGAISSTVGSNVGDRLTGSVGHEYIVKLRLITTGVLWSIAALAFVKQAVRGRLMIGLAVLALSAFPLVFIQSYGGELVLRVALFSMPFMVFAAASLFVPADIQTPMSRMAVAAVVCYGALLLLTFPFNRYGNERMDYFSKAEVAGVQALYRIAPTGASLYAADDSLPWRYEKYADYYYYFSLADSNSDVNLDLKDSRKVTREVAAFMRPQYGSKSSFLIITKSTEAESDLFGPWERGAQVRLRRILSVSPYFRVVYQNPDAAVFELK